MQQYFIYEDAFYYTSIPLRAQHTDYIIETWGLFGILKLFLMKNIRGDR